VKPASHLFRQIPAKYIGDDGVVTSQAFKPMPKNDQGLLSVYNSELIDADASFVHFTVIKGGTAAGTMGVTGEEVIGAELTYREDPESFPEHAVIDMTHLTPGACDKPARVLRAKANKRGWLYHP